MVGLKAFTDNVWLWSRFSEEKGLEFNGTALCADGRSVLIDPVALDETQWQSLNAHAKPQAIVLTNKDHERASSEIAGRAGIPVWIHEADADKLRAKAGMRFKNYDRLPLGIVPIHLSHLKSPGECALYWKYGQAGGVLILGDALIGKPEGELSLLPAEKIPDPKAAVESLKALLNFDFETLIVGDGKSFSKNGKEVLGQSILRLSQLNV